MNVKDRWTVIAKNRTNNRTASVPAKFSAGDFAGTEKIARFQKD